MQIIDENLNSESAAIAENQPAKLSNPLSIDRSQVYTAELIGFVDGRALLEIPSIAAPVVAIAQSFPLTVDDLGKMLAVMLDCSNCSQAIVIGEFHVDGTQAVADCDKIEVAADEELIFKCGKACIKMTSDGTVAIRGANVITRASHTNRIRGGNVQIN